MRRQLSIFAILLGSVSLLGCVSQPQTVKAKLPLVNPNFTKMVSTVNSSPTNGMSKAKAIPELNITAKQSVIVDGNQYAVSNSYTSAMGTECYRLTRSANSGSIEVRPVCHNQTYWMLYPALVESNTQ